MPATNSRKKTNEFENNLKHFAANFDRMLERSRLKEEQQRAAEADARTRRAIERQCRRKYFRLKYEKMGLWPLPPEGTPLYPA